MTRINVVPVESLARQHLMAEYNELPRAFTLMRKAAAKGLLPKDFDIPRKYVLGPGHITFFYDKGAWLLARMKQLVAEMQARGYTVNFPDSDALAKGIPNQYMGSWESTKQAFDVNNARIKQRAKGFKHP